MLKKYFPESEFARNVVTLMTGTTIAQLIPFFISPLLSRIYSPADFGLFALYFSIVSIFSKIAAGRYELAIVLPKDDKSAKNIIAGGFIIALFYNLILLVIIYFLNTQICKLVNNNALANWLYLVPLASLIISTNLLLINWLIRKKAFKANSINKVSQKISEVGLNIAIGKLIKNT